MIKTQSALLSMFSAPEASEVSFEPLAYSDRLRIRHPDDSSFALGPHMDGGSIERWEDDEYRSVYERIFKGRWEAFNAWEMGEYSKWFFYAIITDDSNREASDSKAGSISRPRKCTYPVSVVLVRYVRLTVGEDWAFSLLARLDFPVNNGPYRRYSARISENP